MPKRRDISSILIIGAGPIVIGQACEFDYSGTQACKALRAEGYRIILVNSNPATIMTDPDLADATYIEPLTADVITRIIGRERPQALLATMGGQTVLNLAMELSRKGILDRYGVELIGADPRAIEKAESRDQFNDAMAAIGLKTVRGILARSLDEAKKAARELGFPLIIRPSFTLGGSGGGLAPDMPTLESIAADGLALSPEGSILVEKSIVGWKEYEMEVVRDRADNAIIVCSIENVDPMGVHTGDSITVAPALTLTDKEYQRMRDASLAVLREIGVETGGSNVQFAVDPVSGEQVIIEMNPRVSRSSALASKATGFPIAKVAAKLAVGYTLDELDNDITGVTPASFEPTIDYIVTKIPRFTFEKFPASEPLLGTSMKSVGETMAIGHDFCESLQKALRSMETGLDGLETPPDFADDGGRSNTEKGDPENPKNETPPDFADDGGRSNTEKGDPEKPKNETRDEKSVLERLSFELSRPRPDRLLLVGEALRRNMDAATIARISGYDPWFVDRIADLIETEKTIIKDGLPKDRHGWRRLKSQGFSDARLSRLAKVDAARARARVWGDADDNRPLFRRVDTCAAEFASHSAYLYSSWKGDPKHCEAMVSDRRKAVILGGGPNRIGQGIEFDYCCVHAAFAMREVGVESIMINCNPETVSTDYDTSDRLYFEPLSAEDVIAVIKAEQSRGTLAGVIVQFGGQTPLKLSHELVRHKIAVLGTSPDAIDLAEDRQRFQNLLDQLGLKRTRGAIVTTVDAAMAAGRTIAFPMLLRPSYVLGGRAMEIVHDQDGLKRYINHALAVSPGTSVLIDSYLDGAIEVDVDAISDGTDVYIAGVMEHIEQAGIHSGDSACSLPPYSLSPAMVDKLRAQTRILAKALRVIGLINIQFAIHRGDIFVLEVNPRASRTIPFVAKATGVPVASIATRVMLGARLDQFQLPQSDPDHMAVKEAVFPFARFPESDVLLGPEMKSTGEIMGLDHGFARAFAKSQIDAHSALPLHGCILLSVRDADKTDDTLALARDIATGGLTLGATGGTADWLKGGGLDVRTVRKVRQGSPHIVDAIDNQEIAMVINTTAGTRSIKDSFTLRRAALKARIPYYTTIHGARAAVAAIREIRRRPLDVKPLQHYFTRPVVLEDD